MKWHENPKTFKEECENYPGFVTKFRVSNQVRIAKIIENFEVDVEKSLKSHIFKSKHEKIF